MDISKFDFSSSDLEGFKNTITYVLNKREPNKRKYIRANEAPFITKELHKIITSISKPINSFLKSKNFSDRKAQRTFCKKLSRNTKKTCLDKLDTMKVTDNPILMNLTLNENISTDSVLCRGFGNFF